MCVLIVFCLFVINAFPVLVLGAGFGFDCSSFFHRLLVTFPHWYSPGDIRILLGITIAHISCVCVNFKLKIGVNIRD